MSEEQKKVPSKGSKRRPSKKVFMIAVLAIVVASGVFGYPYYQHFMTHESTEDAFVEAQVVAISPRVSGHVARVLIDDNQYVKQGDLLAEVDARDFKVALDIAIARRDSAEGSRHEAEAKVAIARSNLAQKSASLQSYRAALAQARAGVAEVEAGRDRDKDDLERIRRIAEAGAVSRQEFDHAKAQATMSRAQLNSAKKQVDTESAKIAQAKATVSGATEELRQAYAQVDISTADLREAEAEVEQAKLNLSYTRITAPSDGYVTKKSVEPGAYVQVGQKLFSLVNSEVWVIANFKETQVADMKPGQPVEIEVDAYPDTLFKGRVDSIQRGTGSRFTLLPPENATGNFIKVVQRVPVKIVLEKPAKGGEFLLAPGMSVIPSVDIAASGDEHVMSAQTDQPQSETKTIQ